MIIAKEKYFIVLTLCALALIGCNSGSSSGNSGYKLGGTLSGLDNGQTVTLTNNNESANEIILKSNGNFTMLNRVPFNGSYNVTISEQPKNQACSVENYKGSAVHQDINNLQVVCHNDSYKIGGTVSGLESGQKVTLVNNGDSKDAVTLDYNGPFTFNQKVPFEGSYDVTVLTHPEGDQCVVHKGTGKVTALVNDVRIDCSLLPGTLVPLPYYDIVQTGAVPEDIVVTPDGKYVYVANSGSGTLTTYSVTQDGSLRFIENTYNAFSTQIAVNKMNAYVIGSISSSSRISIYDINPNGVLAPIGYNQQNLDVPSALAINSDNSYLYVTNENSNLLSIYNILPSGILQTFSEEVITGDDPVAVVVASNNKYIYVANQGSNSISIYHVIAGGFLGGIGTQKLEDGDTPTALAVTNDSKHLYVANFGTNTVAMYNIKSDGLLSKVGTVATGSNPYSIQISPNGKYAYVVNFSDQTVSMYSIDGGGKLHAFGNPVPTGQIPTALSITPDGKYVYVTNSVSDTVSSYSIIN